jgi:hypothetical protein
MDKAMRIVASVMASLVIALTLGCSEGWQAYYDASLPGETQVSLNMQRQVATHVKAVVHDEFRVTAKT